MRWATDVYVRARCRTRHGAAKSNEGNACASQIIKQRASLRAVRVYGHIHRVAVIEA